MVVVLIDRCTDENIFSLQTLGLNLSAFFFFSFFFFASAMTDE